MSSLTSLSWELWRKNRACHLLLLALLAVGGIIRLLAPISDEVVLGFAGCALFLTFLSLVAVFSYTDSGVQIAFPPRAFTLPVSTATLVNGPILMGAAVLTIFHAAWAAMFLLPRVPDYPFAALTLLSITALVSFQASIWCLSSFPNLLALELSLLGAALFSLGFWVCDDAGPVRTREAACLCLCLLLALSYVAAWTGVRIHRHGRWRTRWSAQELVDNSAGRWFGTNRIFSTPAQAQLWIERRRNAIAPSLLGAAGVAAFALMETRIIHAGDFFPGGLSTIWLFFFSFVASFWAASSGLLLAADGSSGLLSVSQFLGARPISSGDLAWAKIKLAYGLTVAGWFAYGTGAAIWVVNLHQHGRWPREDEVVALGLTFCLMPWHLIGALPLWLTGRIPSVPIAGLFLIGCYMALANFVGYFINHLGIYRLPLDIILDTTFAAKIGLSAWAFAQCYRRRLLRPGQILAAVAIWLIATAGFEALAFKFCPENQIQRPIAIWLAALMFPLARVGLAPLAVAFARHR